MKKILIGICTIFAAAIFAFYSMPDEKQVEPLISLTSDKIENKVTTVKQVRDNIVNKQRQAPNKLLPSSGVKVSKAEKRRIEVRRERTQDHLNVLTRKKEIVTEDKIRKVGTNPDHLINLKSKNDLAL